MTDLEALAGKAATLAEPNREFFEAVWRAVFPKPKRIWVTDNAGDWTPEYTEWQERQHRFYDLLDAGAWLDATTTLVPEGWYASYICQERRDPNVWYVALRLPGGLGHADCKTRGLALALTAAALRARATLERAQAEGEGNG